MTNELEERNKKRKSRRRRRRLFSLLGLVLLLIYIPAIWKWLFSSSHEIGVIRTSTIEVKTPIEGVIVRNEMLLTSPGTGIVIPTIQNGERVAKNSEVASYIQSDMKDVVESYRQMETDILRRVVTYFGDLTGIQREVWDSAIETQVDRLTEVSNNSDLSDAEDIRGRVNRVLESRARTILDNTSEQDRLISEKRELDRLKSNVEKSVRSLSSPESGIVSYRCDGLEETFSIDSLNSISIEKINKTVDENEFTEKSLTPSEISSKENEPYAKLIFNDKAWIVLLVPEKQGEEISLLHQKAGLDDRQISFEVELNGINERIPVVIEQVGEKNDGVYKVIARMDKMIEKTMDHRGANGNLVIKSVTGMKVPLRSLFNINSVDDTADICLIDRDKAKFVRVQIVERQDNYAIIENIDIINTQHIVNIFDVYLINPKNVEEGQVIDK